MICRTCIHMSGCDDYHDTVDQCIGAEMSIEACGDYEEFPSQDRADLSAMSQDEYMRRVYPSMMKAFDKGEGDA